MSFTVTLSAVAVMLLYALPGYLLIKTKLIGQDGIIYFSKLLMYVCQGALVLYSFGKLEYSPESLINLGICFAVTLFCMGAIPFFLFLVLKKQREKIVWRLICIASVFSNCGFMGVPLLEKLLPDHPEAVAYSCVLSLSMNMVGWSLGLYILSLDKKYISPKKILLNPVTICFLLALPLYFFGLKLPGVIDEAVTMFAKLSAPLCMLIMGMRLATVRLKEIFCDLRQYLAVALNQLAFPLLLWAVFLVLPIDATMKTTLVILAACPVASMVQNYAELLGKGQDKAANMVLLGTLLSVGTVPLICLIL